MLRNSNVGKPPIWEPPTLELAFKPYDRLLTRWDDLTDTLGDQLSDLELGASFSTLGYHDRLKIMLSTKVGAENWLCSTSYDNLSKCYQSSWIRGIGDLRETDLKIVRFHSLGDHSLENTSGIWINS